eukprot:964510-Rhodomonas_salina.3
MLAAWGRSAGDSEEGRDGVGSEKGGVQVSSDSEYGVAKTLTEVEATTSEGWQPRLGLGINRRNFYHGEGSLRHGARCSVSCAVVVRTSTCTSRAAISTNTKPIVRTSTCTSRAAVSTNTKTIGTASTTGIGPTNSNSTIGARENRSSTNQAAKLTLEKRTRATESPSLIESLHFMLQSSTSTRSDRVISRPEPKPC